MDLMALYKNGAIPKLHVVNAGKKYSGGRDNSDWKERLLLGALATYYA